MYENVKNLFMGITVATTITTPAGAQSNQPFTFPKSNPPPAFHQSNPPPVPTVAPDITLSCWTELLPGRYMPNPTTVQIWSSANVLIWSNLAYPPPKIISAEVGPTQISFSGDDDYKKDVIGAIDR